jgi:hypothetical protein
VDVRDERGGGGGLRGALRCIGGQGPFLVVPSYHHHSSINALLIGARIDGALLNKIEDGCMFYK